MTKESICVSVCAETAAEMRAQAMSVVPHADVIELRLDCLHPDELADVIADLEYPKPVLLTRRPVEQGGHWNASREQRIRWWAEMHQRIKPDGIGFFFDIELDINAALHAHSQGHVISFHDFAGVPDAIDILFEEMYSGDANVKIAWKADDICETIPAFHLLRTASETDRWLTPVAMGESGKWTRILGPALGARMTYASPGTGAETAPGQISARDMTDLYRVNALSGETAVFGIIGGNTSYSMSPSMHNAVFAELGDDAVFVPLQVGDLEAFMRRMVLPSSREVEINFKGFAVTNPHKTAIIDYLDELDPEAARIGAVNTVKIDGGRLIGYNTDAGGFIAPLRKRLPLGGSRAAVIGAGGAARACVSALTSEGCGVTVFARDTSKAADLARDFSVELRTLSSASFAGFDVVVNTTPLGTKGDAESETPAVAGDLRGVRLAYDLVYNPQQTRFLREAESVGLMTLGGLEMLVGQAALQQSIWTGRPAPVQVMRDAALARLA